MENGDAKLPYS